MILVMHCCIHFSNQFLVVSSMFFLSKIQMCCSAETLKILILHWFLQCFMKVPIFKLRQSKYPIFAESIKFRLDFLIENPSKNRWKIDIFQHSELDPMLDRVQTPFWPHVGTILGGFWGALGPLGPHFGSPGRSQAASPASAWLSWGAQEPPSFIHDRFYTNLVPF